MHRMSRRYVISGLAVAILAVGLGWCVFLHDRTQGLTDRLRAACPGSAGSDCMADYVAKLIVDTDLKTGFRVIERLYGEEPAFRPQCGVFARHVGQRVAAEIPDYTRLTFTIESFSCDYRFLQGYLEVHLKDTTDPAEGARFCHYVDSMLDAPDASVECFRNLGRVLPFTQTKLYGDPARMARYGVDSCKAIASPGEEYARCVFGEFSSLGIELGNKNKEYGFTVAPDPLTMCSPYTGLELSACQKNIVKGTIISSFTESPDDIATITARVQKAFPSLDPTSLKEMVWVASYVKGQLNLELDPQTTAAYIRSCTQLPNTLHTSCVDGYAVAIAKLGKPREQYKNIVAFCAQASATLSTTPFACATRALIYLRGIYTPQLYREACTHVKKVLGFDCADVPKAETAIEY